MAGQVSQQESRPGIKLGSVPHLTHHVTRGKADLSVRLPVSLFFFPSVVRTLGSAVTLSSILHISAVRKCLKMTLCPLLQFPKAEPGGDVRQTRRGKDTGMK